MDVVVERQPVILGVKSVVGVQTHVLSRFQEDPVPVLLHPHPPKHPSHCFVARHRGRTHTRRSHLATTTPIMAPTLSSPEADALVQSSDPKHPANHICTLCRQFYTFGWVTGTGGGVSIKHDKHIYLAPSGVEKELMQPGNIFVMDWESREYIRCPLVGYAAFLNRRLGRR
jgi:hypothetical protein